MKKFKLQPIDFDVKFYLDLMNEKGFKITDPPESPMVEDENRKHRYMYGPQSPLYGVTYEDEEEASMRYRCNCGFYHDEMFKGMMCPRCESIVRYMKTDPRMTGWISLTDEHKIINPYFYMKMKDILGSKKISGKKHYIIDDIVCIKQKVDRDGHISRPTNEELDSPPTSEYHGIGLTEFYKNFVPIMEHFASNAKSPEKKARIERLIVARSEVFTSHISVYTTLLRPQSNSGTTLYYNKIDKEINPIINIVDRLPQYKAIDLDSALYSIQLRVNRMWDYNYSCIHGKEGMIRGQLKGGSLNYTARNEIIPDATLREDEVDLTYNLVMLMYKNHIIHYYMQLHKCGLARADQAWTKALYKYSQEFYNIMVELNNQKEFMVLINRNPTLNIYSMLRMRLRKIIPEFHQYTMSIPLFILPGFNADFDGDVMNIIGLVVDEVKELFATFDPVENMIVGFDTGYLNPLFSINDGMKVDMYSFLTI